MECEAKAETQHARDIRGGAKARPYKNLPLMILIDEFWLQDTSGPQKKTPARRRRYKRKRPEWIGAQLYIGVSVPQNKIPSRQIFRFSTVFLVLMFSVRSRALLVENSRRFCF